jgi:hypothetical protein
MSIREREEDGLRHQPVKCSGRYVMICVVRHGQTDLNKEGFKHARNKKYDDRGLPGHAGAVEQDRRFGSK